MLQQKGLKVRSACKESLKKSSKAAEGRRCVMEEREKGKDWVKAAGRRRGMKAEDQNLRDFGKEEKFN